MARTKLHSPKDVQAIEILLYLCFSPNNPPKNFQGEDVFAPVVSFHLFYQFYHVHISIQIIRIVRKHNSRAQLFKTNDVVS